MLLWLCRHRVSTIPARVCRFPKTPMLPGHEPLEGLAQVHQQMKAIGYLLHLGCSLPGAFGIRSPAIPADDLHSWMRGQPRGERFRRAVWQEVYPTASLQIDQDGAVLVPLAQGKVIDPQH